MNKVIGFDIGGTSIKYGVLDLEGNILWKSNIDTEAHLGGKSIVEKVKSKIEEIIVKENIIGVAISSAGIIDSKDGSVAEASETIPNYKGQKIREEIQKEFNLKVAIENDVNCAALAELWKGSAKDKENVFCMTIGTGVGGAVISERKILKGKTFSTGEIGYLKIGGDILDLTGSTRGIVKRVAKRKKINENEINGRIIFDLAKSGDKIAIEEIDTMIENITEAISIVSYVINPEVIILGGGVAVQKEYLLERFKNSSKNKIIPYIYDNLEIELAQLGNDAGLIGAVYNFLNS